MANMTDAAYRRVVAQLTGAPNDAIKIDMTLVEAAQRYLTEHRCVLFVANVSQLEGYAYLAHFSAPTRERLAALLERAKRLRHGQVSAERLQRADEIVRPFRVREIATAPRTEAAILDAAIALEVELVAAEGV